MPIFSWVTPTFFSWIRFFVGFVTSCKKINGCCTWKNGHLTPKTSVSWFLGSNAHFFMKYTHFFSPWVDFLFNLDYSEPFGTNLDQFWLLRTISSQFGMFSDVFLGSNTHFFMSYTRLWHWFWFTLNHLGLFWTNLNYLESFSDNFWPIWDIFWHFCVALNHFAIYLGLT